MNAVDEIPPHTLYQRHYHRTCWKCWKWSEQLTTEVWNVTLRRCALSTKEELQSSYALLSLCALWPGNRWISDFLLLFSSVHLSWFMVQPYDASDSYFVKHNKTTRSSRPVFLLMVVTQTVCNDSINKRSLLMSEKNCPKEVWVDWQIFSQQKQPGESADLPAS